MCVEWGKVTVEGESVEKVLPPILKAVDSLGLNFKASLFRWSVSRGFFARFGCVIMMTFCCFFWLFF